MYEVTDTNVKIKPVTEPDGEAILYRRFLTDEVWLGPALKPGHDC